MARNKPRRVIISILFRLLSFILLMMPLRMALRLGVCTGRLCFYLLKEQRIKAFQNLDIAFGSSKSRSEKAKLVKKVFENLGKNFIEIIFLVKLDKPGINNYISCNNYSLLKDLAERSKPVILLSAHLGNWELLAHYLSLNGISLNVVARRVRMETIERFLIRIRKKNMIRVLYRDSSAMTIVHLLKNNKNVAVMPDQDMDSVSGVFVDFFGKKAYTPNGPSALHFLTGADIIPCFIVRKKFGHEVIIDKPMELVSTGIRDRDVIENTQRYTSVIESYIRRFPEEWVWFHDRWKTME